MELFIFILLYFYKNSLSISWHSNNGLKKEISIRFMQSTSSIMSKYLLIFTISKRVDRIPFHKTIPKVQIHSLLQDSLLKISSPPLYIRTTVPSILKEIHLFLWTSHLFEWELVSLLSSLIIHFVIKNILKFPPFQSVAFEKELVSQWYTRNTG